MELPPQKTNRRDHSNRPRVTHAEWALTPEAFAKLLTAFSADEEEASRLYLSTHLKLVRFFEWHACRDPEHQVDITFNRVARKLLEGQQIENVIGFACGVAQMVFMESLKSHYRQSTSFEDTDLIAPEPTSVDQKHEQRLQCLEKCLDELPPDNRRLIVEYYQQETKAKEVRRSLAGRLGIPLNALRIRAHRIRVELEKCLEVCLEAAA